MEIRNPKEYLTKSKRHVNLTWWDYMCIGLRSEEKFEKRLCEMTRESIEEAIDICMRNEWLEGVLLCIRETAKRKQDTERFDL